MRLKERWNRLSVGERAALILSQAVVAGLVAAVFISFSLSFDSSEWQAALVIGALIVAPLEGCIVLAVATIAALRRSGISKPQPTKPGEFKTNLKAGIILWLSLGVIYFVGGYIADFTFPESEWAIKWRYGLETGLDGAVYYVEKQPHNCDFMTAPLGSKHCHYARVVATVRVNDGRVSYDDGKTWKTAEHDIRRTVYVTWNKVED